MTTFDTNHYVTDSKQTTAAWIQKLLDRLYLGQLAELALDRVSV
jgi:hypothetical protein